MLSRLITMAWDRSHFHCPDLVKKRYSEEKPGRRPAIWSSRWLITVGKSWGWIRFCQAWGRGRNSSLEKVRISAQRVLITKLLPVSQSQNPSWLDSTTRLRYLSLAMEASWAAILCMRSVIICTSSLIRSINSCRFLFISAGEIILTWSSALR